ncbi:hypothetical protein CLV51_10899 [Chitinophaga niastensis]|uniref:Uncharacterized protein n=1 Tax=Chitinophaga niastensis TaxID=536980 RepID=A0A2P8HB21_CHINA|nr:hypothetical protein [Chitinophaga niastensis]PSL43410.1 hypothetical protein CLV51_10899 [Chitinophaga niastensis]
MKGIFKVLKYAGVIIIVLEAVKTVMTKVSENYPELLETKEKQDVKQL